MNKYKVLAIVFTVFLIGAIKETLRIFASKDDDVKTARPELIIIACIITAAILFFTIRFWKKANEKTRF